MEEFCTGERLAVASSALLPLEEALSQQRALPADSRGKVAPRLFLTCKV